MESSLMISLIERHCVFFIKNVLIKALTLNAMISVFLHNKLYQFTEVDIYVTKL